MTGKIDKIEKISEFNPPVLSDIPLNKGYSDQREQGN
jgi:hypothetical protein